MAKKKALKSHVAPKRANYRVIFCLFEDLEEAIDRVESRLVSAVSATIKTPSGEKHIVKLIIEGE